MTEQEREIIADIVMRLEEGIRSDAEVGEAICSTADEAQKAVVRLKQLLE